MNKKELAEQIAKANIKNWNIWRKEKRSEVIAAIIEAMSTTADTTKAENEAENELVENILSEFERIGIDTSEWEEKFGDGNFAHEFIAAGIQDHLEKIEAMGVQPDNKIFTKEDARVLLNNFQEYAQAHEIDPPYSFSTLVNKWIDDYTLLNRPNQEAMGEKPEANWKQLRDKFFKECVDIEQFDQRGCLAEKYVINIAPHDLFEWFKKELQSVEAMGVQPPTEQEIRNYVLRFWGHEPNIHLSLYNEDILKDIIKIVQHFTKGVQPGMSEENNVPNDNNTDESPVASHSCTAGNSIEQVYREALEKISRLYHTARSCSLEAQGYNEQECQQIGIDDHAAQIAIQALTTNKKI